MKIDTINSLSHLEIEALRYIEANKQMVVDQSIQELADHSYISTATIMRLCKKIGFSGFAELKYHLKEELEQTTNEACDSFEEVLNQNMLTITETAKMLDNEMVMKVVDVLGKAHHIHFFGKGLTGNVLLYASKLLLTNGVVNSFYEDTHIAHLSALNMNENDVLFLASLSGETRQVVQMGQLAKSKNATIVTFTGNTSNELAKLGTYTFGVYRDKYNIRPGDISSRVQLLFILNIIINLFTLQKHKIKK